MKQSPNPTPNGTKPPAQADAATPKQHDNGPAVIVFGYKERRLPQAAWFTEAEQMAVPLSLGRLLLAFEGGHLLNELISFELQAGAVGKLPRELVALRP